MKVSYSTGPAYQSASNALAVAWANEFAKNAPDELARYQQVRYVYLEADFRHRTVAVEVIAANVEGSLFTHKAYFAQDDEADSDLDAIDLDGALPFLNALVSGSDFFKDLDVTQITDGR